MRQSRQGVASSIGYAWWGCYSQPCVPSRSGVTQELMAVTTLRAPLRCRRPARNREVMQGGGIFKVKSCQDNKIILNQNLKYDTIDGWHNRLMTEEHQSQG